MTEYKVEIRWFGEWVELSLTWDSKDDAREFVRRVILRGDLARVVEIKTTRTVVQIS